MGYVNLLWHSLNLPGAIFDWILFIFPGNEGMYKNLMSSKFGQMRPLVSMATDRVTVGKTVSSCFLKRFRSD